MDRNPARRLGAPVLLGFALLLASCGLAAELESSKPAPRPETSTLEIVTTRLPAAQVDGVYPPTTLQATGARGPVEWSIVDGELPPGMALSEDGRLDGSPTEGGLFPIEVAATDGHTSDTHSYVVAVDAFGICVNGLCLGEVWSGEAVTLDAVGALGDVTFEVTTNESGGAFDFIDEAVGRAVYVPGDVDAPCEDCIQATDLGSGNTAEVTLVVQPHPAPHHTADFGATDVWYIDFSPRFGDHGLPRDWDQILHSLGLRSDTFIPTQADRMACWYVRREILSELCVYFERNADGTQGGGLPISFPMERPGAPYAAPAPGTWSAGASDRYNVMALIHGSHPSILGLAFVDSAGNDLVENDTTSAEQGELGVFGNRVAHTFNAAFQNNTLPASPLVPEDEATLRALIRGEEVDGVRPRLIRRAADNFAHIVAMVLAHEIGHSLGLGHTNPFTPGSIMNAGASIYPGASYTFTPEDLAQLAGGLPGTGRRGGAAKVHTHVPLMPEGGIDVCRFRLAPKPCSCGCDHE